ncbi:MAG TPA: PTS sugar transporter subunit IIA [Longimicrobiales bacterium]
MNDYVSERLVLLRIEARDMEGALGEVARKAAEAGFGDASLIEERLVARERLHSTEIGSGFAIPHATVPGLDQPVVGVALSGGVPVTSSGEGDGISILIVILSPPGWERDHLKILARICRLARHEGFLEAVEAAVTPAEVVEILRDVDGLHA